MMNFPGVVYDDSEVLKKISYARALGKPVDGHAPGLSGDQLKKYVSAGITTDHECSTVEEALEKISLGMKILIREGSAARNLNALKELFLTHPQMVMLCSDDLHPDMLRAGHINRLIGLLIKDGYDSFDVIRSATINPDNHYNLGMGMLREGDIADFVIVDSLQEMNVLETWIGGRAVFRNGNVMFDYEPGLPVNNFNCKSIKVADIRVRNLKHDIRIITASEGELLTGEAIGSPGISEFVAADPEKDILKIVVKDRYRNCPPATGFIKGFRLKAGAFASSIAHDSHNIIAVGTSDNEIVKCINRIVELEGGLVASSGDNMESLQLNIAGIMTTRSCGEIASDYESLNRLVQSMGCTMKAPFMTLAFMALLVIPDLKIGDRGLFDVRKFQPVSLFV
jgi:adenine deaminase